MCSLCRKSKLTPDTSFGWFGCLKWLILRKLIRATINGCTSRWKRKKSVKYAIQNFAEKFFTSWVLCFSDLVREPWTEWDVTIKHSEISMRIVSRVWTFKYEVSKLDEFIEEAYWVEEIAQGRDVNYIQPIFVNPCLACAYKPTSSVVTVEGFNGSSSEVCPVQVQFLLCLSRACIDAEET